MCFMFSASCCGIGVENATNQESGNPGGGGAGGGGISVIPDRPPLELDKLPPYHDVAPSPGEYIDPSVTVYLFQRTHSLLNRQRSHLEISYSGKHY